MTGFFWAFVVCMVPAAIGFNNRQNQHLFGFGIACFVIGLGCLVLALGT